MGQNNLRPDKSIEAMELDPSECQALKQKAEALHRLATGSLSSSINKLSGSSQGIPYAKDFHYYYNFNEFKAPIREITDKSKSILEGIGSSGLLSGKDVEIPDDLDEAYEYLVNLNDDLYERVDVAVDEFKKVRKKEEETGRIMDSDEGFQLVCGKNKKKKGAALSVDETRAEDSSHSVKVVTRDMKAAETKAKVPFHIPSIPRPQDEYKIVVNNSNQPFDHVWLQSGEDGSICKHPLDSFSYEDFVDKDIDHLEPVKPLSLEDTPFKFVDTVNDLKMLAAKLRSVNEFAVDLEHNHYRSFQGLTCLMQISTRTEDFIVDTLKLRIQIGPYLREVFKDPTKRKVIHGSDRDILWLQRDFGIYICNMFDTGQASRVLKLDRNSLEYLLAHLCEVTANKEYQNADWRLRPLPFEMIKYAREDTHYLLYMYDLLRIRLWSSTSQLDVADPLAEVYKRSYDLCMQLYEKELLTADSYLQIYGLQNTGFNAQQLAVVAGLCEWRDFIARAEDESTGYILPNKALVEIAKQMPTTTRTLRHTVRSKYVERNLGALVSIIKHSVQNASAFEAAVEYLKEKQFAMQARQNVDLMDDSQTLPVECVSPPTETIGNHESSESSPITACSNAFFSNDISATDVGKSEQGSSSMQNKEDETVIKSVEEAQFNPILQSATRAIVQVQKKPSRGFGAMFGNSSTKRKLDSHKKETDLKLQQIRSLMTILPSHSFPIQTQQNQPPPLHEPSASSKIEESTHLDGKPMAEEPEHAKGNGKDDILYLCSDSDNEGPSSSSRQAGTEQSDEQRKVDEESGETMSLSDLSSSIQKCFESLNQKENPKQAEKSTKSAVLLKVKPFNYEAAMKEFQIGNKMEEGCCEQKKVSLKRNNKKTKKNTVGKDKDDGEIEFAQGRRRQAFPMTGNRNLTFRK